MQVAWFYRSGVAAAAIFTLLIGTSLEAAEGAGAPGDLDKRTKSAEAPEGQPEGISDSAVRVLLTYAYSILPEEAPGPDGKPLKVDKSDPNKFLIPVDDARRVIRVATRSAYAEVCQLPDLQRANYQTFMKGEEAKKTWSHDQMLMINALHMFSTSYFAGTLKITATDDPEEGTSDEAAGAAGASTVSKSDTPLQSAGQGGGDTRIITSTPPKCPPEQKQKVTDAINTYLQATQATQAPAPKPAE